MYRTMFQDNRRNQQLRTSVETVALHVKYKM